MKLDRDASDIGMGKYGIVNVRRLKEIFKKLTDSRTRDSSTAVEDAFKTLSNAGVITLGTSHSPDEFFLIKLKDKYAKAALEAYAKAAREDDPEYADAVQELANRSGASNPYCKKPD
jgi:hypothetical protein